MALPLFFCYWESWTGPSVLAFKGISGVRHTSFLWLTFSEPFWILHGSLQRGPVLCSSLFFFCIGCAFPDYLIEKTKNLKLWMLPAHSILLAVTIDCGCHIPLGWHSLLPSVRQTLCEAGQQVGMRKMLSLAAGSWAEGTVSMGTTVLPGRTPGPGCWVSDGNPILKKHVCNDTVCIFAPSGLFQLISTYLWG